MHKRSLCKTCCRFMRVWMSTWLLSSGISGRWRLAYESESNSNFLSKRYCFNLLNIHAYKCILNMYHVCIFCAYFVHIYAYIICCPVCCAAVHVDLHFLCEYSQYAIYSIAYWECTICKSIPNIQHMQKNYKHMQ